jgi:hypothetical protein
MPSNVALSILLGIVLAGGNVAVTFAQTRKALRAPSSRFVGAIFAGMGLRMIGVLGTLIVVFLLVPVDAVSFAIAFLAVALVGLVVEVRMLVRHRPPDERGT